MGQPPQPWGTSGNHPPGQLLGVFGRALVKAFWGAPRARSQIRNRPPTCLARIGQPTHPDRSRQPMSRALPTHLQVIVQGDHPSAEGHQPHHRLPTPERRRGGWNTTCPSRRTSVVDFHPPMLVARFPEARLPVSRAPFARVGPKSGKPKDGWIAAMGTRMNTHSMISRYSMGPWRCPCLVARMARQAGPVHHHQPVTTQHDLRLLVDD